MMRRGFLEGLFPPRYDFYGMLNKQADLTVHGISVFAAWLIDPKTVHYDDFQRLVDEADVVRMKLEEQLTDAFTTPFDREDIYTFSVRMDRILEFTKFALLAIQAYSITVDQAIIAMTDNLVIGTRELARGTALLEKNPKQAGTVIETMRKAHYAIQNAYRESLAALFKGNNAMETMKLREVYHEIREASNAFDLVVDVFHRIIVRLV
jgi:uncharacterized protein